jgi:hypothetical protein
MQTPPKASAYRMANAPARKAEKHIGALQVGLAENLRHPEGVAKRRP